MKSNRSKKTDAIRKSRSASDRRLLAIAKLKERRAMKRIINAINRAALSIQKESNIDRFMALTIIEALIDNYKNNVGGNVFPSTSQVVKRPQKDLSTDSEPSGFNRSMWNCQ